MSTLLLPENELEQIKNVTTEQECLNSTYLHRIAAKLLHINTYIHIQMPLNALLMLVEASTVNAFKARLDKFWSHQAVKFDFTAVLTGTGNRSEELKKL